MRFFKNLGRGIKNVANGISRGIGAAEKVVNMIDAGIVDATKAIKHALINAISASNTLLFTDHIITNKRQNG